MNKAQRVAWHKRLHRKKKLEERASAQKTKKESGT